MTILKACGSKLRNLGLSWTRPLTYATCGDSHEGFEVNECIKCLDLRDEADFTGAVPDVEEILGHLTIGEQNTTLRLLKICNIGHEAQWKNIDMKRFMSLQRLEIEFSDYL
mmetsp:Transcript_2936/g.7676  ORF Transcript_2936/g.7676 Transcript_2936/m.7676 type:complete len:111 (-) Transcript_2936:174-506(-)